VAGVGHDRARVKRLVYRPQAEQPTLPVVSFHAPAEPPHAQEMVLPPRVVPVLTVWPPTELVREVTARDLSEWEQAFALLPTCPSTRHRHQGKSCGRAYLPIAYERTLPRDPMTLVRNDAGEVTDFQPCTPQGFLCPFQTEAVVAFCLARGIAVCRDLRHGFQQFLARYQRALAKEQEAARRPMAA
jgi:hypothetical protein